MANKSSREGLIEIASHEGKAVPKARGKMINEIISDTERRKNLEERNWPKVDVRKSDECWEWKTKARHPFGYGRMTAGRGVNLKAHQIGWCLENGPIPNDKQVLHKCDNPSCCNPKHLFLGTARVNIHDAISKGRLRLPPRMTGAAHPNAKLTSADFRRIRQDNRPATQVAPDYSICTKTVYRIRSGELSR